MQAENFCERKIRSYIQIHEKRENYARREFGAVRQMTTSPHEHLFNDLQYYQLTYAHRRGGPLQV